jgi:hypothetical protein
VKDFVVNNGSAGDDECEEDEEVIEEFSPNFYIKIVLY